MDAGETQLFESAAAVDKNSLWTVSRSGGEPAHFHEFGSDQIHSGVGVSPVRHAAVRPLVRRCVSRWAASQYFQRGWGWDGRRGNVGAQEAV